MDAPTKPTYTIPQDAVWFITGCSSGLGLSLAKLIAAHPTQRVVATARGNTDRLRQALTLEGEHPRVLLVQLDVTDPASVTTALDTVLKHPGFGRIDVLGSSSCSSPVTIDALLHADICHPSQQRRLRVKG